MSRKYVFLGLLAVLALAAFLRLWQIKTIPPGFYPDEAMNGNNALEALDTGNFKWFYPENNGREGLWMNMLAPFIAIFGNEPEVPRSMAAIFGILTVLGIYFLTKELFYRNLKSQISNLKISRSEIIALLAAFFLATSFWHINFSRMSFRAILAPFFLVWSFYFLWKIVYPKIEKSINSCIAHSNWKLIFQLKKLGNLISKCIVRSTWKLNFQAALGGLLFGLGFHTYIVFRIAPLLLIFPFIKLWKAGSPAEASAKAGQKNLILIFLIFAFLSGLPLGIYFLGHPQDFFGRTSQVSIFAGPLPAGGPLANLGINIAKTTGMFFWQGDSNWRHNFSGMPELWWPVAILFLIGFIISIKNLHVARYAFLVAWLIVMLLPVVISNEGIPHALRSIAVIPAVMIFAALGLDWIMVKISDWLRKKRENHPNHIKQLSRIKTQFIALFFVFLLGVAVESFNQYFLRWAPNPNVAGAFNENYVDLGRYLNTLATDVPKYVIVNASGIDVRGIPMSAQTTMFITKTFLPKWQTQKNIFYVNMANLDSFLAEASQKNHLYIAMLEIDSALRLKIKQNVPGLKAEGISDNVILYK